MVKRRHFEVLQKKSSNMPRVVWAEECKNGPRFEIGPSYDGLPTRSQYAADGQSSCIHVSIHLSIYLSLHPSIRLSIYPSIYPSTYLST